MRCPYCSSEGSRVVDSRVAPDGAEVRRRRECGGCGGRFTTYERAAESLPRVIKRSGARAAFDEARVRGGMLKALEKRRVSAAAVEAAVERVRRRLPRGEGRDVSSAQVGEWVMAELRELDRVAYVRFASVYRRFEDAAEFRAEVDRLGSGPLPGEPDGQLSLLPREEAERRDGGASRNGDGTEGQDGDGGGKEAGIGEPDGDGDGGG